MKKMSILIYLVLSYFAFTSCEQQDEIDPLKSSEIQISIDTNSQVYLAPTISTKDQIENAKCGSSKVTTLFAGQHINAGEVIVSNDENYLFVTYNTTGNWWLKETHLFVGSEVNLPLNGGGNPKIGHFPYHGDHDLTQSYTFTIPLNHLEECYVISTHAVVVKKENSDINGSETAFGFGEKEFPGSRWGWYFKYCSQECDDNDDEDDIESGTCLNAFAYNATNENRSYCFSYTDSAAETNIGWSNEFNYYLQQGKHHTLPIFAKVEECDTDLNLSDKIIKIGYVDIFLFHEGVGDGMQLYTNVKYVINNDEYILTDTHLYLKNIKFPNQLDPLNGGYNYDTLSNYWNSSSNTFEKLPWPGTYNNWDTYFIPNATVCKK